MAGPEIQNRSGAPCILIVEDSRTQAALLRNLLEENGYDVLVAENGRVGLEKTRERPPALVISDVNMPEMNGFEMCRAVVENPETRDIPVMLLTSLSEPDDIVSGIECGASGFVTKPYDRQLLLDRVKEILDNKALRRNPFTGDGIELIFRGRRLVMPVNRLQILDLLLSSYDMAVQQKRDLEIVNGALRKAQEELRLNALELKELSLSDELTVLSNRRGFMTLAEQQVKLSLRSRQGFALLYIDLDNMKPINDRLGHKTGDQALVDTAAILRKSFRESDILARIGGDEFVVLLVGAAGETSDVFVKNLKSTADGFNQTALRPFKLQMSIGAVSFDPDGHEGLQELLQRADQAMYRVKQSRKSGRADPEPPKNITD
ncbi:MAG: diguanylate cyclase [Myxococcota bacterium]|jgi:diguanylate cyclase (GGDEF)-like protein